MKPKVLITVRGGIVQSVDANMDMDIVTADFDEKAEEYPILLSGIKSPDQIFEDGKAHELFLENAPYDSLETFRLSEEEKQVKQFLKDHNF
jgi:hypothetical protein